MRKHLLTLSVVALLALALAACGAPEPTPTPTPTPMPEVTGTLTNQASGKPLAGARVILCRSSGKTCTVQLALTAVTDAEGKFLIPGVESGKYVVLYNGSGEKLAKWDGLEIDFTPVQGQMGPSAIRGIVKSLGVETLSVCALQFTIQGINKTTESGYLYSDELDLALILVDSEPVAINAQGKTTINLSVWNTREGECDNKNFDPVQ